MAMISVAEASQLFRQHLDLWSAGTLAEHLYSDRPYPPFHRVMMDGIAVSFKTYQEGVREFSLQGIAPAGSPALTLSNPTAAIEVMTGAPLPHGSDLVIPYEHLSLSVGIARITVTAERSMLENVHLEGSDCRQGEIVLREGSLLNGPHIGIAASMGYQQASMKRAPKIMIISTGDELVEVSETPMSHQIRRSNAHALKRSLELNGLNDISMAHLPDVADVVASHYEEAAPAYDLLIYSGGVSKGKYDYLPSVWKDLGVSKHFHEVAQRPGKPLWFGTDENRRCTVVGLPGNPVSSLICLHRYLIPSRPLFARLSREVSFKKDLTYFVPVSLEARPDGVLWASPAPLKNSGEFTALAGSDGFIELPRERSLFKAGESFAYWGWRAFR